MPTNYPTSIDILTNPVAGDTTQDVPHAEQHANANDGIEALQAKVGADSSAVITSHDYKLSGVTSTDKAVSKTGSETLTNKTLTSPVINTGVSGTAIDTDANLAADSDTILASQKATKAYVDSQVTAQDLDIAGDAGTGAVDLDSQSLIIAGASGLETSVANQTATVSISTNGVDDTHIDFGTGANQVSAVDLPIADAGVIIAATEVEGALQENRTAININTTHRGLTDNPHTTTLEQARTAGDEVSGVIDFINNVAVRFKNVAGTLFHTIKAGGDDSFLLETIAGKNVKFRLGDAAGANFIDFVDSAWGSLFKIDTNGDITVAGTIDGRDIAADGSDTDLNTTHRGSDGKDHSDVVLNNTHRAVVTGNPHSVTQSEVGLGNVTNVATDDTAYNATSWNTNTDSATKNAIRDKVETMDTAIGSNTSHAGASSGVHGATGDVVGTTDTQTLTNKTMDGDLNTLSDIGLLSLKQDGGNANKFLNRNGSGDVVANAKAIPSGVVIGTTDTQTLTNKTLSSSTNTFPTASETVTGDVELATIVETDAGTDTTRALTSDGVQGSFRNLRFMYIALIDSATDDATATTIGGDWVVPFTGTIVQDDSNPDYFAAYTDTAGITGTMVVDIHLNGTTIMDTNKLDIETGEKDTTTATTQPDLTTTAVTAGDILTVDIDAVHTTAAKGLKIMIAIRPN